MLVIKIIQFSFLRCQWTNDFHDMPAIYTDLSLPFPSLRCQRSPINLPAMLKIKIIQFSSLRCQWSSAIHGMPVIFRSFRSLPWDVSDHRSIRSLTWHASDQDHSVLFLEMSVIECLSWHASDLQIFPFPSLRCRGCKSIGYLSVIYRSFRSLLWDARDLNKSDAVQWSKDLAVLCPCLQCQGPRKALRCQ
jgi:hypothetical protein